MISISILDVTNKELSLTDKIKIVNDDDEILDTVYNITVRYTDVGIQVRAYDETKDPDNRLTTFILLGTEYSPDFIIVENS